MKIIFLISMDTSLIKDSFDDYIKSLVQLKEAVNGLRIQARATNKAVEKLLTSTHLNAVLKMTREVEFLERI